MGLKLNFKMYGHPEDDDFLRRIRFGICSPPPIPPITDSFMELGDRAENLTVSLRKFRRNLTWALRRQKPNNWLRRHGIPMRRKMEKTIKDITRIGGENGHGND